MRRLGYSAKTTMQNLRAPEDDAAGWSCLGDRDENKQGTLATYLLDAAAAGGNCKAEAAGQGGKGEGGKNNASPNRVSFVENCAVDKVRAACLQEGTT